MDGPSPPDFSVQCVTYVTPLTFSSLFYRVQPMFKRVRWEGGGFWSSPCLTSSIRTKQTQQRHSLSYSTVTHTHPFPLPPKHPPPPANTLPAVQHSRRAINTPRTDSTRARGRPPSVHRRLLHWRRVIPVQSIQEHRQLVLRQVWRDHHIQPPPAPRPCGAQRPPPAPWG